MFKYKFLKNGVSYSGSLLIGYGLSNGHPVRWSTISSMFLLFMVGGRQLHNQVSGYLGKSYPWYLSHLQLIPVSLHLFPFTQGAAICMGLNVFYHLRPVVVSFDQGIGFPYTKMVMHLLDNSFDKGLLDDSGLLFLAIFPVYVVQQICVIILI